jgi:hypothetical protein
MNKNRDQGYGNEDESRQCHRRTPLEVVAFREERVPRSCRAKETTTGVAWNVT